MRHTRPEPLWIGDVGERRDELGRGSAPKLQHRADLVPLLHRPIVEPLRGLLVVQVSPRTRRIGRGAVALPAVEAERHRAVSIVGASPLNTLHQPDRTERNLQRQRVGRAVVGRPGPPRPFQRDAGPPRQGQPNRGELPLAGIARGVLERQADQGDFGPLTPERRQQLIETRIHDFRAGHRLEDRAAAARRQLPGRRQGAARRPAPGDAARRHRARKHRARRKPRSVACRS